MRRRRTLLRFGDTAPSIAGTVGSLALLVAFAFGVPIILIAEHAGSPIGLLERLFAHPSSLLHSLGRPVSNQTVVHVVVLMAWLVWVWLVACVVAELVGRLRGRPASRLPASRHAQALAALLVGASMAFLPSAKGYAPMRIAGIPPGTSVQKVISLVDEVSPKATGTADRATSDAGSDAVRRNAKSPESGLEHDTYVVRPGDTLWSIAGRELGSPLRWSEIAALNIGRPQADGSSLVNAGWILPGWVLALPPAAPSAPRGAVDDADYVRQQVTGTEPSRRSDARSKYSPSRRVTLPSSFPQSSMPRTVAPAVTTDSVSEREPSSDGRPNAPTARVPESSNASAERVNSTDGTGDGDRVPREGSTRGTYASSGGDHDPKGIPVAPFGYGLLGAGVVMVINRLRRAQQRHRPSGLRIALPDKDLAGAEQMLRSSADHEAAAWVDAALRTLAAACRSNGRRAPRVVAVRILDDATELIVAPPPDSEPVAPFERGDSESSWYLPRRSDLLEDARDDPWIAGMDVMSPGLVTLGRGAEGLLLVDVEQAGSISMLGSDGDDVLRAMAIELATSSWSEQVNVVVVGMDRVSHGRHSGDPTLDVLDRVREAADLVEVLPELRHVTTERSVMLDAVGYDRTSDARLAVSGDGWDLTVVFCSSRAVAANRKALDELVALAGDGDHGLATVCAGSIGGANWLVEAGNGPLTFRLAGLPDSTFWPQTLDDDAGGQIAKLVDVARHLDGVDPATPPYDVIETRTNRSALVDDDPPPAIEILVLGPVEVVGAARPFTRAWSLELVVYLAMHPGGASSDQWATHLWPSRSMAQASLHSTASAARRALGSTATGEDHLPRSHGRLALGPGVATDWDRFCRLAASGDPGAWKRALELIRGLPFEGLRSTDWAVFSHVQANIESLVVDVSVRRAEYCIDDGDAAGAEWSARQGLLVSPYDERLYRVLMRAADLAGNPAGVEAVMAELLQLVGGEVEPYDSVHPETYELYRSLSRRHVPARHR